MRKSVDETHAEEGNEDHADHEDEADVLNICRHQADECQSQKLRDAGGHLEEEGVEWAESEAVDQDRVEGGNAAVGDVDRDRVKGEEPSLWIAKGFPHLVGLEVSLIHDTGLVLKSATDSDRALF